MINNSTLLFIIDESKNENEIININELFDADEKSKSELNDLFDLFDYFPSDELIMQQK